MRITMISEHASPLAALGGVDAGGQNVHVAALSKALAGRGHAVTVFTRRDDALAPETVEFADGVTVVSVTAGPPERIPKDEFLPFMPELGRGVARYWSAHPETLPDVVHSHFWMSGLAARTALHHAELDGVPLVHTFHALGTVKRRHQEALDTSPAQRADLEPQVGRDASHIIATCRDEVAELGAMGIPSEKVSVVPCGVDLSLFRDATEAEDTGGKRRIVCVGRLVARKGMDLVVRALARLVAAGHEDVELHIIGGSAGAAGLDAEPGAARLRALAEELGVADRLVLRGQVPREAVPAVLRSAALVACTPWYEPFGIVPLEAMACGVPVVAARVGGLADTVVDGVTGLHVPPRDPDAIAHAAARLLADPGLAARLGRNGMDRAREKYAWPVVAEATEAVYRHLLTAASPGPAGGAARFRIGSPTEQSDGCAARSPGDPAAVLRLPVPEALPETAGFAPEAGDEIEEHLAGIAAAVESLRSHAPVLRQWSRELAERLRAGHRLLTAGNGGSAAEAQHLSSELVGRFARDRPAFSSIALHTDTSAVTAIGNDYGYENVFARQVEAHARPGDILLLLTTSGKSPNLLRAARTARRLGVLTWALTGPGPNPLSELCDTAVTVEAASPNVQEAHLMAIHGLCRAFDAHIARAGEAETVEADAPLRQVRL